MNGLTALLGLEMLGVDHGGTLAVTGAAGLLGSYVVGLAKDRGLTVIADAKPEDAELVRGFGADVVVPRGEGFVAAVREAAPGGVDAIYDTALLHDSVFGALSDGGAMAVIRGWKPDSTERGIVVKQVMVTEGARAHRLARASARARLRRSPSAAGGPGGSRPSRWPRPRN